MKNNCLFTPLPQPLSFSPRCNLFLVLNICIDYQCIHKHVQVYIVHETHGLCGTMLHTLLCILLFHLVYLGSSLFHRYPAGEYLFPIFFYLNSSAIIIPYRCHFTWKQIYLWGEFLEVALLSQGVSLLLILVDIAKLLSHRVFQFAFCQPMFTNVFP